MSTVDFSDIVNGMFGPQLLGTAIGLLFHGILLSQIYNYFLQFPKDRILNKIFVIYVLIMETLGSGVTIAMVYEPLIQQFGQPAVLARPAKALFSEPAVLVGIATPIHFFVANRIRTLQNAIWIPLMICLLSCSSFAGGIWVSVQTKRHGDYTDPHISDYVFPPSYLWLTSSASADSLIAVSLAWSLYRKKTGFAATDAVISRIILFSVQTGIVTSVAALVSMITFVALPLTNTTTFVFNVLLMKLYGNFMLATLNNRGVWHTSLHEPEMSILFPEPPKRININQSQSDSMFRARRVAPSVSPQSKDTIALGPMKGLQT